MSKKPFPATEYLIVLFAAALRFYRLGAQSLWSDEGNSVAMAHRTFAEIAARTARDIHPPLYYWLLKIWVAFWGDSEFAVRALSAMLGVLLVAAVFRLGKRWYGRSAGLAAALLTAVNPFQLYYAQEARMYMLLTLLGTLAVYFAWETWQGRGWQFFAGYALAATAGLYTHYAFPVMLVVINLAALFALWREKRQLAAWLGGQGILLALFAPWLPIAIRQVTTWPQSLLTLAPPAEKLFTIGQYLALGISAPAVDARWLWVFGAVFLISGFLFLVEFKLYHSSLFTIFWLFLPAGLTFFLFRSAYLKFLLVASPAFLLFLVSGFRRQALRHRHYLRFTLHASLLVALLIPSARSLYAMYFNPAFQRDNYRQIAATIRALGTTDDAVILHAPGQAEVFGYYFSGDDARAQVIPLPRQRPINATATIAALEKIAAENRRIFGVFWATEEADPDGVIEGWLNAHTFKASDVWFGNVRLVQFAPPAQRMESFPVVAQFGDAMVLAGYQLPLASVSPGDILQIGLQWQAIQSPEKDYTVFVQVLDAKNHLVGQRDAAPQPPTSAWEAGVMVNDRHGVEILPGTPPGEYRLVVGLYDSATGERLSLPDGRDFLPLTNLSVTPNASPLPIDAFGIQQRVDAPPLVGVDIYPLGHAAEPDAPIRVGSPVHVNLYWQKSATVTADAPVRITLDGQEVWRGSAVTGYPMNHWRAGEILRGQANFFVGDRQPGKYMLQIFWGNKPLITELFIDIVP